jgi:Kef-type K+ transport system membrane component KefB/nucleotide-binding universal stress UspA family protein
MEQPFTAASHHDVLVLIVQIAVLLFTARMLGELAQRLGQPSVVGEILAGIVLGPSCLSGLFPFVEEWIVPQSQVQGYLLEVIGLLGVIFLLLITGLETDLILIRQQARSALGVAAGGLILPLVMGFALGQFIPEDLLGKPDQRFVFSLYLAIAMAISAIPVIAKVLMDLNLTRRDIGQTIIAAAMLDDTTGWILLSIVIGLASGEAINAGHVAESVLSVVGLMAVSFTIGQWIVQRLMVYVENRISSRDKILSLVVLMTLMWSAISQALHLEALLGAFLMGIIFSQMPRLDAEVIHKIESMALGIFAPVFFAIAGLKVNLLNLLKPDLILAGTAVIVVAIFCKVIGVYSGARWIGKSDHWTALFYGAGLNARGSMGIIVATIGLNLGLIHQDMFSLIVLMAVITSVLAPAMLGYTLSRVRIDAQEQDRLRRETLNKDNIIANVHRVLLPVRARPDMADRPTWVIEARILERLTANSNLALTLMTVTAENNEGKHQEFLNHVGELFALKDLTKKVALSEQPADAILDEVKKGYDLLILGASERRPDAANLFTPVIDTLVRLSPCPTIIVHGPQITTDWNPRRVLVATTGSVAGRRAAQLGFRLVDGVDGEVIILKVVERSLQTPVLYQNIHLEERELGIAHEIVDELEEMGRLFKVHTIGQVKIGVEPETTILQAASEEQADLIILGTNVRPGSERLYLGPRVERILLQTRCPVVIFNTA